MLLLSFYMLKPFCASASEDVADEHNPMILTAYSLWTPSNLSTMREININIEGDVPDIDQFVVAAKRVDSLLLERYGVHLGTIRRTADPGTSEESIEATLIGLRECTAADYTELGISPPR
jgi:hypothetical protein